MYKRKLKTIITEQFYKGKVVIIYGARRVGKTSLCNDLIENEKANNKKTIYLNCEFLATQQLFSITNPEDLKKSLNNAEFIVFDEAQHIKDIGLILKILIDTYPELQIVATGSSSFDLANKTGETLTGRARRFVMYPLSVTEISNEKITQYSNIDQMLIYGSYPSVFAKGREESLYELSEISSNYLYKDALLFEKVKGSHFIAKLLKLLALQIGNEVSTNELAISLSVTRATIERYIDILEKCFVIFRLSALSRNSRKEITKNNKIYFYDLGIRNCLIQNFNQLNLRSDVGALWENFCVSERMKRNSFIGHFCNYYFWRTYDKQEVDYIEEYDGILYAYEFKHNPNAKIKTPKLFMEMYNAQYNVINRENCIEKLFQN